ncbi:SDR family NAD(P)-dependent oxidoreductase [Oxalobacteraceae bacterium A2-2]
MHHLFDLSGRVALVTGADTGLGQDTAVALAAAGADIVAAGRSDPSDTPACAPAVDGGWLAR